MIGYKFNNDHSFSHSMYWYEDINKKVPTTKVKCISEKINRKKTVLFVLCRNNFVFLQKRFWTRSRYPYSKCIITCKSSKYSYLRAVGIHFLPTGFNSIYELFRAKLLKEDKRLIKYRMCIYQKGLTWCTFFGARFIEFHDYYAKLHILVI